MRLLARTKLWKSFLVKSRDQKSKPQNVLYHFYPSAKDRREQINEWQVMIFDEESASDAQKFLAPPKRRIVAEKIQIRRQSFWNKNSTFSGEASKNEMSGIVWKAFFQSFTAIGAMLQG